VQEDVMRNSNRPNVTGSFRFWSERGDFIGGGANKAFLTSEGAKFELRQTGRNILRFGVTLGDGLERTYWNAEFAAPKGQRLRKRRYSMATRFPFQKDCDAGLTISGEHRGSNKSYGSFWVDDAVFNLFGTLVLFRASFAQRSETIVAPELTGAIYYRRNDRLRLFGSDLMKAIRKARWTSGLRRSRAI
jgi:hypothetical protein